jgi:hypothetical protein
MTGQQSVAATMASEAVERLAAIIASRVDAVSSSEAVRAVAPDHL